MVIIHASCMLAGFLSIAAGITIARCMRDKPWWLRVHRRLGSLGVISAFLGLIAAIVLVSRQTGQHGALPHAWLGLAAILFILCTYLLGLTQLKRTGVRIRSLHRWSGRVTLVLFFFTVLSGLSVAGLLPL